MNYIELINYFWRLNSERPIPPSDFKLYFTLLDTCNKLGWKNPFGQSDRYLAAIVGVAVNTIRDGKKRLVEAGLIEVTIPKVPSKSITGQSIYFIKSPPIFNKIRQTGLYFDTVPGVVPGVVPDVVPDVIPIIVPGVVPDTNNKLNLNKTKVNNSFQKKNEIDFSVFNSNVKSYYPNVSLLPEQMTYAEFYTLTNEEFRLGPDELNNLLKRMENYRPLVKNSRSVFSTMRNWHLNDIAKSSPLKSYAKKSDQTSPTLSKLNEGPTIGNR